MSTPVIKTQGYSSAVEPKLSQCKEECAMRYSMPMKKENKSLVTSTMVKLLGGLALGALLATAAVLPFGLAYADEPLRPLTSEQIEDLPGIFEETVLPGRYRETLVAAMAEGTGIVEETVLPGRYQDADDDE